MKSSLIRTLVCSVVIFSPLGLGSQTTDRPLWRETLAEYYGHEWIDIKCSDSLHCLISGWVGIGIESYLLRSDNGGRSWTTPYTEKRNDPVSGRRWPLLQTNIAWPVPELAIVAADSGYILRSTDTGKTWLQHRIFTMHDSLIIPFMEFGEVSMFNHLHGVIYFPLANSTVTIHQVMTTNDGGQSWNPAPTSPIPGDWPYGAIREIVCTGPGRYICIIYNNPDPLPMIARTEDGGETWLYAPLPEKPVGERIQRFDFQFLDSMHGFMSAIDYADDWLTYVAWTDDGGETWQMRHHDLIDNELAGLVPISFLDTLHGIGTAPGYIARTSDGGRSWSRDSVEGWVPSTPAGGSIQYLSKTRGLMAGSNGGLYIWDAPVSGVQPSVNPATPSPSLLLLPGDDNTSLHLLLHLPESAPVSLQLYNPLGELIHSHNFGHLHPGSHPLRFPLSSRPRGMFFLRLNADTSRTTFRVMLP